MTAKRKYKWNVVRSTIYIYPDTWENYVYETLHATKEDAEQRVKRLNDAVHPAARNSMKYSLEKKKNV